MRGLGVKLCLACYGLLATTGRKGAAAGFAALTERVGLMGSTG